MMLKIICVVFSALLLSIETQTFGAKFGDAISFSGQSIVPNIPSLGLRVEHKSQMIVASRGGVGNRKNVWSYPCKYECDIEALSPDGDGVLVYLTDYDRGRNYRVFLEAATGEVKWSKEFSERRVGTLSKRSLVGKFDRKFVYAGFMTPFYFQFIDQNGQFIEPILHGVPVRNGPLQKDGLLAWTTSDLVLITDWRGKFKSKWEVPSGLSIDIFGMQPLSGSLVGVFLDDTETLPRKPKPDVVIVDVLTGLPVLTQPNATTFAGDDNFIIFAVNQDLVAFNRQSLKPAWRRTLPKPIESLYLAYGNLLAGTPGQSFLLNPRDGTISDQMTDTCDKAPSFAAVSPTFMEFRYLCGAGYSPSYDVYEIK